jgi:hypothetical protein
LRKFKTIPNSKIIILLLMSCEYMSIIFLSECFSWKFQFKIWNRNSVPTLFSLNKSISPKPSVQRSNYMGILYKSEFDNNLFNSAKNETIILKNTKNLEKLCIKHSQLKWKEEKFN